MAGCERIRKNEAHKEDEIVSIHNLHQMAEHGHGYAGISDLNEGVRPRELRLSGTFELFCVVFCGLTDTRQVRNNGCEW